MVFSHVDFCQWPAYISHPPIPDFVHTQKHKSTKAGRDSKVKKRRRRRRRLAIDIGHRHPSVQ
jgi:hypothetical protein